MTGRSKLTEDGGQKPKKHERFVGQKPKKHDLDINGDKSTCLRREATSLPIVGFEPTLLDRYSAAFKPLSITRFTNGEHNIYENRGEYKNLRLNYSPPYVTRHKCGNMPF